METKQQIKEVTNDEFVSMLNRCKHEILDLRRQLERAVPRAEAYDNLVKILRLLPQPGVGVSEDLVWRIEQRLRELTEKEDAKI